MEVPKEIRRIGSDGIEIIWSDGSQHQISSRVLRLNCPSADNKARQGDTSHAKPLSGGSRLQVVSNTADEELRLDRIDPVGNYAIRLVWGDGHDTGIYSFSYLRELSEKQD